MKDDKLVVTKEKLAELVATAIFGYYSVNKGQELTEKDIINVKRSTLEGLEAAGIEFIEDFSGVYKMVTSE